MKDLILSQRIVVDEGTVFTHGVAQMTVGEQVIRIHVRDHPQAHADQFLLTDDEYAAVLLARAGRPSE